MKNQWFVFTSLENPKETKTASPFVVNIEGVMAIATTFVHSSLVEPIEND